MIFYVEDRTGMDVSLVGHAMRHIHLQGVKSAPEEELIWNVDEVVL